MRSKTNEICTPVIIIICILRAFPRLHHERRCGALQRGCVTWRQHAHSSTPKPEIDWLIRKLTATIFLLELTET